MTVTICILNKSLLFLNSSLYLLQISQNTRSQVFKKNSIVLIQNALMPASDTYGNFHHGNYLTAQFHRVARCGLQKKSGTTIEGNQEIQKIFLVDNWLFIFLPYKIVAI